MLRPRRLVAVCGTGTEVGKTWVGAHVLAEARRRGLAVAARKPVQSFDPAEAHRTDAHVLAEATGESPPEVCPTDRWYGAALAPPMAAAALGRPSISITALMAEIQWPPACDLGLLETIGGVRSPIGSDGDCVELLRRLSPDVVLLVADAGLGTINAVRLSLQALGSARCVVLLNRFDPSVDVHRRNLAWLTENDALDVVTEPARALDRLLADG